MYIIKTRNKFYLDNLFFTHTLSIDNAFIVQYIYFSHV